MCVGLFNNCNDWCQQSVQMRIDMHAQLFSQALILVTASEAGKQARKEGVRIV